MNACARLERAAAARRRRPSAAATVVVSCATCGPLLALAAALEQIAQRLDEILVVHEVVPAEQLARREHRKVLVGAT